MTSFSDLGISMSLIKALEENEINRPTEIQQKVIPYLLQERTDLIAHAQTGTGKTAAFGLPLLQSIDSANGKVQGLILVPTRELGQQIAKQLFRFTKYYHKIFTEAVYGGVPIADQIKSLDRPTQIVVATPGRLIDLLERKAVSLSHVRTIILDEADEMISMGFKDALDNILEYVGGERSIWLFSATIPKGVKQIIGRFMSSNAPFIQVDKAQIVNKNIEHQFVVCEIGQKLEVILQFLQAQGANRGLIFCRTKAGAQSLASDLIKKKQKAEAIHGDLSQKERDKVMRAFKNEKIKVLVATDMAARGIDVNGLSYVVHHQLPEQLEYYTHRSGRTARAGKSGMSLSLITPQEIKRIKFMERELNILMKRVN